ncbi:MAG: LuxR C-terminal-related transcriptional regulator [Solirubrobacteraceae bacterium]
MKQAVATAPPGESRVDRQLLGQVARFLADAAELPELEAVLAGEAAAAFEREPDSLPAAASELAQVGTAALAAVEQLDKRDRGRARRLSALSLRALELSDSVHNRIAAQRVAAYATLRQGLDRLRRLASSATLLDRVCPEVVESCGFRRAILTRVENDEWLPWMAHFPEDPELEHSFTEWMTHQRFPASALGRDLLRLRPVVVRDAHADTRAYGPMIDFSKTVSFVAAPITPAGRLVGVLYADNYPSERPMTELDRDLLFAFAEDFGRTYERVVLIERMRTQQVHISKAFEFAENMMSSLANAEIELSRTSEGRMPAGDEPSFGMPAAPAAIDELLTAREGEVLAMMVRGASNATIAEQLIIKEGTVKSHVKHILRKLDAVNRAEAISRYIGRD